MTMRCGKGVKLIPITALMLGSLACGYHTSNGKAIRLPADLHTLAIPAFKNVTTSYGVEQILTKAVVREFLERTQYRVIEQENANPDATLRGMVTGVSIAPLTSDSQTGRLSTAMVTVSMNVSLVARNGKLLYSNPGYIFREQYQISREPSTFFQEEGPAVDRLSRDFARTLVSNVLEAY